MRIAVLYAMRSNFMSMKHSQHSSTKTLKSISLELPSKYLTQNELNTNLMNISCGENVVLREVNYTIFIHGRKLL